MLLIYPFQVQKTIDSEALLKSGTYQMGLLRAATIQPLDSDQGSHLSLSADSKLVLQAAQKTVVNLGEENFLAKYTCTANTAKFSIPCSLGIWK